MLSKEDRARIFLPFDALNGLHEALHEKEIQHVDRIILTEEMQDEIAEKLLILDTDTEVEIVYYSHGQYVNEKGLISKLDTVRQRIIINGTTIKFIDIFRIDIL